MLVITILWLPALVIPLATPVHGGVAESLEAIDFIVWALFALEYVVKFTFAPDRRHYVKTHILELIVVVVPFLRPLRIVVGLCRVGVVFAETLRRARSILTHNGFHFVVLTAATLRKNSKRAESPVQPLTWFFRVGRPGLDPGTLGLKVPCSSG